MVAMSVFQNVKLNMQSWGVHEGPITKQNSMAYARKKKYQKAFWHNISESYLKSDIFIPRDFSDIFI